MLARSLSPAAVTVQAIDAAQPFDFEHKARAKLNDEKRLKVGIVGFGTFGQFLAKRLVARGHRVLATSRTPYDALARQMGVEYFQDADDFCEEHPDVRRLRMCADWAGGRGGGAEQGGWDRRGAPPRHSAS